MSADKSLDILIQIQADLEAGKSTVEVLRNIKDAAGQLAPETGNLSGATEEGAKKFKLFENHGHEVKKVINELTRDFPAAGMALRFFVTPIGAILTGAILIFRAFKKDIDETNKALDELGQKGAQSIGNMQASLNEAREAAAKARQDYEHWRKVVMDKSAKGVEAMEQELSKLHELDEAYVKSIEIQMAAAKAKVEIEEKDPAIKAAKLAAIDAAAEEAKNSNSRKTAAEEKKTIDAQLEKEREKMAEDARRVTGTETVKEDVRRAAIEINKGKTLDDAKAALAAAQAEKGTPEAEKAAKEHEKRLEKIKALESEIRMYSNTPSLANGVGMKDMQSRLTDLNIQDGLYKSPEDKEKAAQAQIETFQNQLKNKGKAEQDVDDARLAFASQKKRVEDLEKKKTETDRKAAIEEQLRQEREKAAVVTLYGTVKNELGGDMMSADTYAKGYRPLVKRVNHQQLTPEEQQAADRYAAENKSMNDASGKIVREGFAAAQFEAHGGKLDETQKRQLEAFKTLMQTIDGHGQKHIDLAKTTTNVVDALAKELSYLHNEQLKILSRLNTGRAP